MDALDREIKSKPEQFLIRLPAGLRDQIKDRATRNRRTMNSEILVLIEAGMRALERQEARV